MTDYKLVPNLQQIVTEALVGMVSGVTQMVPPADEPLPDFIQAPIDRAVTRIRSEIDLHAAAAPAPVERNQCDGRQAGIPVENGMHRMGKPDGYADLMACAADRYGAAPAVQGEPVQMPDLMPSSDPGYPRHPLIGDGFSCGADWMRRQVLAMGPLYTAPQPAEQQPDVQGYVMVPAKEFESVLNRADWRTAKNRAELRHMLKALQSSAAPDVAGLVEALERAHMALIGYLPGHRNDITDAAISQCEQVLATYRKEGEA